MKTNLLHGDCLEVMKTLPDASIDSIVTDPPYGIKFMSAQWDYDVPRVEVWREALRVLKPGAYLLSFASTRTQHRMAVNIEDAGFGIRDCIGWVYAQGMPKSGGLKPAWEPIIVARKAGKPVRLNIDQCRVVRPDGDRTEYGVDGDEGSPTSNVWGDRERVAYAPNASGRYPSNFIHDGSDVVCAMFPDNNPGCRPHRVKASTETVDRLQEKGWGFAGTDKVAGYDDGGDLSAARFFYCSKPNKKDRNEGTEAGNPHLTVKPTDLMQYLCRLVTPPGGTVLDPFMGSGSTGKAAVLEGFDFLGIEREAEYLEIAKARISAAESLP